MKNKELIDKAIELTLISYHIDALELHFATFDPIRRIKDSKTCFIYERLKKAVNEARKHNDEITAGTNSDIGLEFYEKANEALLKNLKESYYGTGN